MNNIFKWSAFFIVVLSLANSCKKPDPTAGDMEPGVALTFDDASVTEWMSMLPILKNYDAKVTFFVCTACTPDSLNKSNLNELYEAGNEIGSHTHHHLNTVIYLQTHTPAEFYTNEILPSLRFFDSINIPVTSFAYPDGSHSLNSDKFLLNYFTKLRAIGLLRLAESDAFVFHKSRSVIYGAFMDRNSPYHLKEIKNAILLAKEHHAVLILVGHSPGEDATNPWSFPLSLLDSICNFTVQQQMKFYRIRDL